MWTDFRRTFARLLILFLLSSLLSCGRTARPTIAVVPKAQSHFFWQAVHAGAVSAANEAGYEVLWNGPASEADFAHQIRILDDLINRRVSGILIAPSDREALVPAIETGPSGRHTTHHRRLRRQCGKLCLLCVHETTTKAG